MPAHESSQVRRAWSARSYEGIEHPAKPSAARRSWPRWSSTLLDDLVGSHEYGLRDRQTKRLRGLEIDDQFELGWLLHRKIRRLRAPEDLVHISGRTPEQVQVIRSVGHETTGRGVFPKVAHCREPQARQTSDRLPPLGEE